MLSSFLKLKKERVVWDRSLGFYFSRRFIMTKKERIHYLQLVHWHYKFPLFICTKINNIKNINHSKIYFWFQHPFPSSWRKMTFFFQNLNYQDHKRKKIQVLMVLSLSCFGLNVSLNREKHACGYKKSYALFGVFRPVLFVLYVL